VLQLTFERKWPVLCEVEWLKNERVTKKRDATRDVGEMLGKDYIKVYKRLSLRIGNNNTINKI
jgi:hypothetical protein